VSQQTILLIDEEGQMLGRGSGYKAALLADLADGSQLSVGQREVEISGVIDQADWENRLGQASSKSAAALLPRKGAAKRKHAEQEEEDDNSQESEVRSLVLERLHATTAKFKPFKMPSRVGADSIVVPRTVAPGAFRVLKGFH
jgi:hypothetical protein